MFGFDPVTLPVAYILAGLSQCPQQGEVDINVQMEHNESPPIVSMTAQQMNSEFGRDPDSSFTSDSRWLIAGLTRSRYQGRMRVEFGGTTDARAGTICLSANKVHYSIIYSPEVYIASDFKKMGCRYSVTVAHEKRHVDADTQTITDYLPEIKKGIKNYFSTLDPQDPFNSGDMENQKQRMVQMLGEYLKPLMNQLDQKRRQRQAEIDTPQIYRRDTALCPGQYPAFPDK